MKTNKKTTPTNLNGKTVILFFFLTAQIASADALLLTLQVENSIVGLQEEFVLTLEIYGSSTAGEPEVGIEGLESFRALGLEKHLMQVPGGKTVKWVFRYRLLPPQEGVFKLGPARAAAGGRVFHSNTLFLTVEKERVPKTVVPPRVTTAQDIGDRVLLLLEADQNSPYVGEGFTVQIRLLSQLPVENLSFRNEPDFPGFLRFDYPLVSHPQALRFHYHGQTYVGYDIIRFLLFPLREGKLGIPSVEADLQIRILSGTFRQADLILKTERRSNSLMIQARSAPAGQLVGNFSIRSETVSHTPRSAIVRRILEGNGLLTLFDLPISGGEGYRIREIRKTTGSRIQGKYLFSQKVQELEVLPNHGTTDIVLQPLEIRQFDPTTEKSSLLVLPALPLHFEPPTQVTPATIPPFPESQDLLFPLLLFFLAATMMVVAARPFGLIRRKKKLSLRKIWTGKNLQLPVSRKTAHLLYQQLAEQLLSGQQEGVTLMDLVKRYLPQEEWLPTERTLRKLEWNAFSSAQVVPLTYGELKETCERLQRRWNR